MKEFLIRRKIAKYEKRLEKYGDDCQDFRDLAQLHLQVGETEHALRYYHHAIEAYYQDDSRLGQSNKFILELCWDVLDIAPLDALAHRTLSQEYCGLGEFQEAVKLHLSYGKQLLKVGRYDDAILQYKNAQVLAPDDIELHQSCFSLFWKLRRKKEALQELQKIAELAEQRGNLGKAMECYRKALKIVPSNLNFQAEFKRLAQISKNRNPRQQLRLVVNK